MAAVRANKTGGCRRTRACRRHDLNSVEFDAHPLSGELRRPWSNERRASQRCCNTTPYYHSIPLEGHENEPAWGVQHPFPRGESLRVGGPVDRECSVASHAMVLRVCQKLSSIAYLDKAKLLRINVTEPSLRHSSVCCDWRDTALVQSQLCATASQKTCCIASSPCGERVYIGLRDRSQQGRFGLCTDQESERFPRTSKSSRHVGMRKYERAFISIVFLCPCRSHRESVSLLLCSCTHAAIQVSTVGPPLLF